MNQIFFDIGQTLINEIKFIKFLDENLFELINGFGAKIDFKNYLTLRNNIIKTNKMNINWAEYLVLKMSILILPNGYEIIILKEMKKRLNDIGNRLFFLFDDAIETLERLSCKYKLGIISNDIPCVVEAFHSYHINKYFNQIIISNNGEDNRIDDFVEGVRMTNANPKESIMVGDRIDMDILPANKIGMKTIRFTGSIFRYQESKNIYEKPNYIIENLNDLVKIL